MAGLNPESLAWIDKLNTLKAQPPDASRSELQKVLKLTNTRITELKKIKDCFDPAAIEKIRQAASPQQTGTPQDTLPGAPLSGTGQQEPSRQMPHIFSYQNALALARLNGRVADLPAAVHAALDVVLARQLPTKDIKKLVAWIINGKPTSEFDPKQKAVNPSPRAMSNGNQYALLDQPNNGSRLGVSTQANAPGHPILAAQPEASQQGKASLDLKKFRQLLEKAEAERIQGNQTTAQDKLEAYILKTSSSLSSSRQSGISAQGPQEILSETVLLDWLADINIIKQLQSKRKKGKSLKASEWCLLAGHKIIEIFGHLLKLILKLFKLFLKLLHTIWKLIVDALKELGIYKYAKAIFTLAAVIVAIWFAWEAFHYGVMRPVEMVWSKIHHEQTVASEPTLVPPPVPTPSSTTSPLQAVSHWFPEKKVEKPAPVPSPSIVYQPSIAFVPAAEDPKLLKMEIASIESNSRVSDYAVTIDETMPGDVAATRMQRVADPDKYTLMIGGDKQAVLLINPTTTGLEIHHKSTDPFNVLGRDGLTNIIWEDVKAIHISEIDTGTKTITVKYQFSLITEGAKYPLTLLCNSTEDLQHLVSTMEYFIRNSRLGHDTALGGMPYLSQGLVLNNQCVVEKLWADGPADRAGLQLGDHLWSVGKAASDQQDKKVLEAGLQSSSAILYVASPAEWTKAKITQGPESNSFRPKLRKVVLPAL